MQREQTTTTKHMKRFREQSRHINYRRTVSPRCVCARPRTFGNHKCRRTAKQLKGALNGANHRRTDGRRPRMQPDNSQQMVDSLDGIDRRGVTRAVQKTKQKHQTTHRSASMRLYSASNCARRSCSRCAWSCDASVSHTEAEDAGEEHAHWRAVAQNVKAQSEDNRLPRS